MDASFFSNSDHLKNTLDLNEGIWEEGKERGYGIVIVNINNHLTFAIPIRSRLTHKAGYITKKSYDSNNRGKGLDYSSALLITKQSYIRNDVFKIPPEEHKKLKGKDKGTYIRTSFEKYVTRYINAVKKSDEHILYSPEYRYTTLINYHDVLGI